MRPLLKVFLIVIMFYSLTSATKINVPADQSTIQDGIDAATNGDTVLVQPGTYNEYINFNGKNIVVGSLFLTTGNTSYISNTVIDGGDVHMHPGVEFTSGEDSTAVLTGFTITNFKNYPKGGGIRCEGSGPSLMNLIVSGNTSLSGGGISCEGFSRLKLVDVIINDNKSDYGGGLFGGGGIYCDSSEIKLVNVTIRDNNATTGGGILCRNSEMNLINVTIADNNLRGFICEGYNLVRLTNVTVKRNAGGGISCGESSFYFDPINRCNIYLNQAHSGRDIRASNPIKVVVDTFTVINPTNYYASPIENFEFDILHAKLEPVSSDLYVNPVGNNANSGQSASEPLKTISFALSKIIADNLHPHTIYLSEGVYNTSSSGEIFPLYMLSYVSLSGESKDDVILDGEGRRLVMNFFHNKGNIIEKLTITGGSGGIYSRYSDPKFVDVNIRENNSAIGAGILCYRSNPSLVNVIISDNSATSNGGGFHCMRSDPILLNVTIVGNSASAGGGLFCQYYSDPILVNTILWNNTPQEICFVKADGFLNSITMAYSDIQGGEEGIITNNNATVLWMEGNINADPFFVDPPNSDYRLTNTSPCIGAGIDAIEINGRWYYTPSTDIEGHPRPNPIGSRPDMGAYESELGNPITGIEDIKQSSEKYVLTKNYPNPFNPSTTIEFTLPSSEFVILKVYNILGEEIATLVNNKLQAGNHTFQFDGSGVASGVYLYRIEAGEFQQVKKMVMIK